MHAPSTKTFGSGRDQVQVIALGLGAMSSSESVEAPLHACRVVANANRHELSGSGHGERGNTATGSQRSLTQRFESGVRCISDGNGKPQG